MQQYLSVVRIQLGRCGRCAVDSWCAVHTAPTIGRHKAAGMGHKVICAQISDGAAISNNAFDSFTLSLTMVQFGT